MKTIQLASLALIFAAFMSICPAFAQSTTAGVRLEAGIAKEEVDGDLKSAIEIYQKIAADSSAARDVRAKALLRLAGCYEKLGRQARQLYEQIVRDYADQPAANQARTRLATLKQQEHPAAPTTITLHKIERAGINRMGPSDTDGQRVVYADSGGNLFFGDLAGHNKRMIFKGKPDDGWIPSRDFSKVAVCFLTTPHHPGSLAVIKIDGTGYRQLIRDDARGTILGSDWGGGPYWSWDDRYLLLPTNSEKGSSHLWVISVADGQRRELLTLENGEIGRAQFSPDGRFVAYEVAPPTSEVGPFRIFVLPVSGGASRLVYESNPKSRGLQERWELLDWTADSRYLAVADSRYGTPALYLYPVKNGATGGTPVLVRHGDFTDGYTTASGALVYESGKPGGNGQVHLASFDSDGHLGNWRRLDLGHGNWTNPSPSFSPDGSQIAYTALDEGTTGPKLFLYTLSTGQERLLHSFSEGDTFCHFAAHVSKLFCISNGPGGTSDLFSVGVNSGEVQRLASFPEFRLMLPPSNDDQALYFGKRPDFTKGGALARWELATGQETVLSTYGNSPSCFSGGGSSSCTFSRASLDYRWQLQSSAKGLSIQPISGGEWKLLAPFIGSRPWVHFSTTPDGNSVLYRDIDLEGKQSLFRVPIAGGQPQRLGDFPAREFEGNLRFSSDGRQILASTYASRSKDLWMLENFVPSAKQ